MTVGGSCVGQIGAGRDVLLGLLTTAYCPLEGWDRAAIGW